MRFIALAGLLLSLTACETQMQAPRPVIPANATVDEARTILCRQPPSSIWYQPCRDM